MSCSLNSDERSNISESSESLNRDKLYRREIIKRVVEFAGLFYLIFGIFVAYIWTSKGLDAAAVNNTVTNYFCDPVITFYSLGNMAVFAIIILVKYWSYNFLAPRLIHRPDNHIIACFMIIPLFIASVIFNVIELVRDLIIIPCHGYMSFLAPLSTLAITTGAAILIFDVGYFRARLNSWFKDLIKSNLIFFILIGITNCLLLTVSLQHMKIFRNESLYSTYGNRFQVNESCFQNKGLFRSLNSTFTVNDKYLRPMFILFCVCTLAYLIQPTTKYKERNDYDDNERHSTPLIAQSSEELIQFSDDNVMPAMTSLDKPTTNTHRVSYRLPSASLIICITFLSLSLLAFIITYSLNKGESQSVETDLGGIIYCTFLFIEYAIGSGLSVVHIKEIKRWPLSQNRRGTIIDKCLIWVGAGGTLTVAFSLISSVIISLTSEPSTITSTLLLCLIISTGLLMLSQTFLQTIQVSLLLDRKWIRPDLNSLVESLCPAVGLMGLNMGLLLLSIDQLRSPIIFRESKILFVDLFSTEMRCVGETLGILQRLHASLLFASMIVFTHN